MKTKLNLLKKRLASSLLVTLFMMTILAVSIAGYLYYIEQQNRLSARSQAWNMAMAVSEAGIEEGLEALNSYPTQDCPPESEFTGNGWTKVADKTYMIQRDLPNGSYVVTNNLVDCYNPIITARGFVTPPALASGAPQFFFATVGAASPRLITRAVQVKTTKTSIWVATLAARGSIGMSGNSPNALVDSFDDTLNGGIFDPNNIKSNAVVASLDGTVGVGNWDIDGKVAVSPTGSTSVGPNGYISGGISQDANFTFPAVQLPDYSQYMGPTIPGTNWPTMVSPGSTSNCCSLAGVSLNPTNQYAATNVFYYTNTVPSGCNPVLIKSNGIVSITDSNGVISMIASNLICGTTEYNANTLPANACSFTQQGSGNSRSYRYTLVVGTNVVYQTNITYTYSTNEIITFAQTNYTVYTLPVYQTNRYDHVLCGTYYITDASALGGSTYVACPSTVVALGGVTLNGNDQILIGPGASLTVYSDGNVALDGNGVINTNPGVAQDFSLICTTNVTTVDIGGNGQFSGTILAPNANVTLNGGGSTFYNFIGAVMANNITLKGHMRVNYPESLGRKPSDFRYLVVKWQELDH